jgi:alpha-glucosidase
MLEQQREKNVTRDDVFAFGSSLLVAPVTDGGIRNRDVYLPRGTWYRYATSTGLQGGRTHRVSAALHSIPMFAKGGSVIPEGPVMQHVNEVEVKELRLQVYFSRNRVSSLIYDDAGDGYGYESGEYSERKFVTRGEARRFVIRQDTQGSFEPTFTKYRMNVFGLPFKVRKVMIDGNKMNQWSAGLNGVFRLKVPRDFHRIEICS